MLQDGMLFLIFAAGWGARVLYVKKVLREKLLSEEGGSVALPLVIPLRLEIASDRQKLARWLAYGSFGFVGVVLGYVFTFSYDNAFLSFAGPLVGGLLGIWLTQNIRDLAPTDETLRARTAGKEIVIEHGVLKLTRAINFIGPVLSTDEPNYLVIPLASDAEFYLCMSHGTPGDRFRYLIKHSGRRIWISATYFVAPESDFIAALKQNGVTVKPLSYY